MKLQKKLFTERTSELQLSLITSIFEYKFHIIINTISILAYVSDHAIDFSMFWFRFLGKL